LAALPAPRDAVRPSIGRRRLRGPLARIAQMLVTMLVASFVTFSLLYLTPGDPVDILLGNKAGDRAAVARLHHQYHLDVPFLQQYWHWLSGVLTGDFGTSFLFQESVGSLIASRLPTTLLLVAMGGTFVVVFGFVLGLLAARAGRAVDSGISLFLSVALATPSYVVAIALITVFSLYLHWFPVFGSGSGFFDRIHHLVLPAISLALAASAGMARVTRASILEEGTRDHVTTAVARGLEPREVLWRHVVRNALLPITTTAGVTVASLIAGTVIVEKAYGLDGVGSLLVLAITRKDYPVVLSVSFLVIVAFLVVNAVVDLLYTALDPRTRAARS
jgi:peptide/nickel transport system permease protein